MFFKSGSLEVTLITRSGLQALEEVVMLYFLKKGDHSNIQRHKTEGNLLKISKLLYLNYENIFFSNKRRYLPLLVRGKYF